MGVNLCAFQFDVFFRYNTIKHKQQKKNKLDLINIKKFCALKDTTNKVERQLMEGRKYLQVIYLIRNLYLKYFKSLLPNNKKTNGLIKKWAKDQKRYFSRKDIPVDHKHTKVCSTSLVIWEMQMKITLRSHLISTRMSRIKKTMSSVGEDMELEPSCVTNGDVKWCSCYGKQSDSFSKCSLPRYVLKRYENMFPKIYRWAVDT